MSKPKKDSYASDEELAWFKISNYSFIRGKTAADFAGPRACADTYMQWATMIRDRVELARFLDAGDTEYVATLFDKLKADPFTHLGFSQSYRGGAHATNAPTVKALTANRVRWLNEAMLSVDANERAIVDAQLASDPESVFSDYAHVMVNLRATDKQIRGDFTKWLAAWRNSTAKVTKGDYQNKISHWAQAQLLPYIDLELFSKISGRAIDFPRKFDMLLPGNTIDQHDAHRRRLSDTYKLVLTDDMAKILAHLAESGSETTSGKIAV